MIRHRLLHIAGALAVGGALLHTFAGTREVHGPLLDSDLDPSLRLLLYACWHIVTVALLLTALALVLAPRNEGVAALARPIGVMWFGWGLVFVIVDLVWGGPSDLLALPQWALLLPVGVLAWLGGRTPAE